MSHPASSLPERWVQRIFATMRATYGAAFDRQWECPAGTDPADHIAAMLEHWGRELRGYQQNAQAIAYALENLPEHPPNLIEFRALCRRRPDGDQKLLEAPRVPPAKMLEAVSSIARPEKKDDYKQWARDMREREKSGAHLTLAQRAMWKTALENDFGSGDGQAVAFTPIPAEILPPAMRQEAA